MTTPLVSVVTTVYNCEKFVKSSLESILAQDFTDFELLLVNDGSTDDTWDVCETFDDPRIVFVNNKDNKRIPTRRNEAIDIARGTYIAIHDGDDESLPFRLQKQVDFFETNDDIFCLGGHAIKIGVDDEEKGLMTYPPPIHNMIVNTLRRGLNPIIDPTSMFRKKDFIELGGYTLEGGIYTVPDLDFWARAIVNGRKFHNLRQPLIRYRINPDGVTRKHKTEMMTAHNKVIRRFYSDFMRGTQVHKRKQNE